MKRTLLMPVLAAAGSASAPAAPAAARCPEAGVSLRPDRGAPSQRLKIAGTGLEPGRPVWLHWRHRERAAYVRTPKLADAAGHCGFTINRRLLEGRRTGLWRMQFDHGKRPAPGTAPQLWGEVSVQRKLISPFRRFFIALRSGTRTG
jgi:hypothetical protein